MKTIGFIDYFLDNWHANQYPKMIKAYNEEHGTDYVVKYAWAEKDGEKVTTDEWCANYEVERCASIKEVCEKADFIMILAPSSPETHLGYAEEAFKYGKVTYVDKTFAPDLATAQKIFDLAKENNVKFFSSSALRFAQELVPYADAKQDVMTIIGAGIFDEYVIHCIEMAVKFMGIGATKVRYEKFKDQEWGEIQYADGRFVRILMSLWMPYGIVLQDKDGVSKFESIDYSFFKYLLEDIMRFFETGKPSFDVNETLEVIKVREKLISAKECEGQWINL